MNSNAKEDVEKETIIQLATVLDHLTGEECGMALEQLNGLPQVLDAILLNGLGKKNRPCGLLQVLCHPEDESCVVEAIFRHTHTLGIRRLELERYVASRKCGEINLGQERIPAKIYEIDGLEYVRPEADAIKVCAQKSGKGAPAFRFDRRAIREDGKN